MHGAIGGGNRRSALAEAGNSSAIQRRCRILFSATGASPSRYIELPKHE
jgi:hypothetical protein